MSISATTPIGSNCSSVKERAGFGHRFHETDADDKIREGMGEYIQNLKYRIESGK
jgi:hypothetical protein